jgi:hypothetical protein
LPASSLSVFIRVHPWLKLIGKPAARSTSFRLIRVQLCPSVVKH